MAFPIDYLRELLFIDIETVSAQPSYDDLDERTQDLWNKKAAKWDQQNTPSDLYPKAALLPEFGKIIVIGVGFFYINSVKELAFRVKAFTAETEQELLRSLKTLLEKHVKTEELRLVAHNGKGFDFPYLARRMIIHGIPLPKALQLYGKSPWQIPHIDTMEMWRMGDIRTFVSLELLSHILGIPSSKTEMDGSQVNRLFYQEESLHKIAKYCCGDVVATAQVYLRMMSLPIVSEDNIEYIV